MEKKRWRKKEGNRGREIEAIKQRENEEVEKEYKEREKERKKRDRNEESTDQFGTVVFLSSLDISTIYLPYNRKKLQNTLLL